MGEMFANNVSDKGVLSRIYKVSLQLNNKDKKKFQNIQKIWIDISFKKCKWIFI